MRSSRGLPGGLAWGSPGSNSPRPVLQKVRLISTRVPKGFSLAYSPSQRFSLMPSGDVLFHEILPGGWESIFTNTTLQKISMHFLKMTGQLPSRWE